MIDPGQSQEEINKQMKEAKDATDRALEITQKDLENIPTGLAIMLASLLFGRHPMAQIALSFVYAVSRVLHSVMQAYSAHNITFIYSISFGA